jgi:hypothetical protein
LDPTIERNFGGRDNLSDRDRADRDEDGLDPTIERNFDRRRLDDDVREETDDRNSRRMRSTLDTQGINRSIRQNVQNVERLPDATRNTEDRFRGFGSSGVNTRERGSSGLNTRELGSSRLNTRELGSSGPNTRELGSSGMTTAPRGNSGSSAGSGLPSGSTAGSGRGGGLVAPSTGGNRPTANPTRTLRFPDARDTGRDRVEDRLDRRRDELDHDLDLDSRDFERRSTGGTRTIPRRVSEEDIRRTAEDWGDRPFEFGAPRASTRGRTQAGLPDANSRRFESSQDRLGPRLDVRSARTGRGSGGVNNSGTSPRRELRTPDIDIDRRDSNRRPSGDRENNGGRTFDDRDDRRDEPVIDLNDRLDEIRRAR